MTDLWMERADNFVHLSSRDKTIFLRAAVYLAIATLGREVLTRLSSTAFHKLMVRSSVADGRTRGTKGYSPKQIAWGVTAASRYIPGADCLPQAIATRELLRESGYPSSITIGIAKVNGEFRSHAWVTFEEQVIIGGPDVSEYQPMLRWTNEP